MKIGSNTIKILQNFASINQGIVIRPGSVLRTMNDEGVFAEATIEESFEKEFGIYDLKKLLAILSMQKNPDLTVSDAVVTIKGDKSAISVRHTNTKLIKSPPADKRIVANYFLSFPLTVANIKWIFDTSSILGTRHVVFQGKDGRLTVEACDMEGKIVDAGSLDLGETTFNFKAVFYVDRLKLMAGDYDVSVSKQGVLQFALKNAKLVYWVALLQNPSEFTTT